MGGSDFRFCSERNRGPRGRHRWTFGRGGLRGRVQGAHTLLVFPEPTTRSVTGLTGERARANDHQKGRKTSRGSREAWKSESPCTPSRWGGNTYKTAHTTQRPFTSMNAIVNTILHTIVNTGSSPQKSPAGRPGCEEFTSGKCKA